MHKKQKHDAQERTQTETTRDKTNSNQKCTGKKNLTTNAQEKHKTAMHRENTSNTMHRTNTNTMHRNEYKTMHRGKQNTTRRPEGKKNTTPWRRNLATAAALVVACTMPCARKKQHGALENNETIP